MTLNELFKNTTYDDTLFSVEDKSTIESSIHRLNPIITLALFPLFGSQMSKIK